MGEAPLKLVGVAVRAGGRVVVEEASLEVGEGELLYLLGPNGSGKTSLLRGIVGYPGYEVVRGAVLFEGEDVSAKPMDYRVSRGLGLAHQIPPKISGLKLRSLLGAICKKTGCDPDDVAREAGVLHLLDRDFGKGFSGGELKRAEMATLLALRPRVALIDEPDSGVDVDSIAIIARAAKRVVELSTRKAALVVTHSALIAKYLPPTRVCLMVSGRVGACGGPELLEEVFEHGFKGLAGGD